MKHLQLAMVFLMGCGLVSTEEPSPSSGNAEKAAAALALTASAGMQAEVAAGEILCGPLNAQRVDLLAGQHILAGKVAVWKDSRHLYVKYCTAPGWFLRETHLAVSPTLEGIPQTPGKKSNPIPGRFPHKEGS